MTSPDTEAEPGTQDQNAEWIDKAISDAFSEFHTAISHDKKLHKSEQLYREAPPSVVNNYDIINTYHAFCKLCEKHFYCRSVASDINSFFQKHINTSYHKQIRSVDLPANDAPMFTWEEKFLTGRCNLCQISGINSYVLDSSFDSGTLMKLHVCVWDNESRESNWRVLRRFNLLKKYCGLKIFEKKLIKTIKGSVVCLLCGTKLPWSEDKARCHLGSEEHYQKFCQFLQKCFNFGLKDLLNGYNLEMVTRTLLAREPPPINTFSECNDKALCLEKSNDCENPYPEGVENFNFSPKQMLKLIPSKQIDFIHNNSCLLCNVAAEPEHFDSELHRENAKNLNEKGFDKPANYKIYRRNVEKRLRITKILKKLELMHEEAEAPPQAQSRALLPSEKTQKVPSDGDYFTKLFAQKLDLLKYIFTASNEANIFCEVCNNCVPFASEIQHLTSSSHQIEERRWNELKTCFENKKFTETLKKMKNAILCLVCGSAMHPNNFFSHVKGEQHRHSFQWYSSLNLSVPISSAIVFKNDLLCFCTICNSQLSEEKASSLKLTARNIASHWPCKKLKKESDQKKQEVISKSVEKNTGNNHRSVQDLSQPDKKTVECGAVDFKKVEKTVKSIMGAVEGKIIEKVMEKSAITGQLQDLQLSPKNKVTKILVKEKPPVQKQAPPKFDHSSSCKTKPAAVDGKLEEIKKMHRLRRDEFRRGRNRNEKGEPGKEGENEEQEDDHEVLVIKGLARSKRRYEKIYSQFSAFGKIRYILSDRKLMFVAFENPGVAENAIKGSSLFTENPKVTATVVMKSAFLKSVSDTPPTLKEDLVQLLEDPQKLMDFALNLIMQAVAASESAVEKKREELVCNTIITAIYECFPKSRCYCFGSRLSGLTLKDSDLDVFLDCGGMFEGLKNTAPTKERKLVISVGRLLRKSQEIKDIIVVDRARVPIVSFLHKPTLMRCDLSFKNGLSIQNTLLIKFMTSLDWRVRPLILFLKHWAKKTELHGPPNFSSYAISMLVIYYLQQLEFPVLPTIESLQNYNGPRTTVGGWDCSINMNTSSIKKSENKDPLPQLLVGLFELYANFDYKSNVISPLTGKLLPRKAFSSSGIADLPMSYKRHILNIPPPIEDLVNDRIVICIVDPFDVSHVLTKSFTRRSLQNFIILCQESEKCLRKGLAAVSPQS